MVDRNESEEEQGYAKSLAERADDGFLRMKVERWLSLLDIRLELRTDEEKVENIRGLFLEFIEGLNAGIRE